MRYRHKRLAKYDEYEFEMIKKSKRYFSKCLICGKILSNSCLNQLKAHRVKCISKKCPPERREFRGNKATRSNNNFVQSRNDEEAEVKIEDGFDFEYPASLVETKYDQLTSDDDSSFEVREEEKPTPASYDDAQAEPFEPMHQDKILETNLENTKCRGCFTYKVNILFSEAIQFYSEETHRNEQISYLLMFHECTSIKINQNFHNSEGLCNYCAEELTIAYSFRRKCLYANHQYMLLVNEENKGPAPQESTSQESSMQSSSNPSSMMSQKPIEDIIEIYDDDDIVEISTPATSTKIKQSKPVHKKIKKNAPPPEYIDINHEHLNGSMLIQNKHRPTSIAAQTYEYHKKCKDLERRNNKLGLHQTATKNSYKIKIERRLHK